jgi:glycosyltransferase involved in cell wall biosynthesis
MPAIPASDKLRVLHLASGDLWGGAEAVVHTLIREQHRREPGSVGCVLMNAGQLAERLAALRIPLRVLDESRQGVASLVRDSGAFVDEWKPHVLHAHRRKENLIAWLIALRRIARRGRLARVTTIHGMPEPVTGGNVIKRGLGNFTNELTLALGFDALVAVSGDIQSRMRARFPRARVACVHNGVESQPAAAGNTLWPRPLELLALGRLVPIKRFERLRQFSDALAALRERPVITLAGDGPLRDELMAQLHAHDPASGIRMPGFVAQPDSLFERTDALLITSDHEGIPMVALEALARGTPVFGFAVGGLPEIAASGVPMILVPVGDSVALARAVHDYFGAGAPAPRRPPPADWIFSIAHCADDYQRLYASIARGSADPGEP